MALAVLCFHYTYVPLGRPNTFLSLKSISPTCLTWTHILHHTCTEPVRRQRCQHKRIRRHMGCTSQPYQSNKRWLQRRSSSRPCRYKPLERQMLQGTNFQLNRQHTMPWFQCSSSYCQMESNIPRRKHIQQVALRHPHTSCRLCTACKKRQYPSMTSSLRLEQSTRRCKHTQLAAQRPPHTYSQQYRPRTSRSKPRMRQKLPW
jgi:hypothetical protein